MDKMNILFLQRTYKMDGKKMYAKEAEKKILYMTDYVIQTKI